MTITAGTTATHLDFNLIQSNMEEILGLGENGYGLSLIASVPAEEGQLAYAQAWNNLLFDINIVNRHITNTPAGINTLVTGTSIITASPMEAMLTTSTWLLDDARRYTCHPSQFYVDPVSGKTDFITSDSTSTRTYSWGANGINIITHRLIASFPNRLAARYYFNLGSYLTFFPYYEGLGLNDLDAEWENFIDYLRAPNKTYTYRRSDFVDWSSTTTSWTSGTLSVSVVANKSADETRVEFIISYANNATATLIVTPAVATWTILV